MSYFLSKDLAYDVVQAPVDCRAFVTYLLLYYTFIICIMFLINLSTESLYRSEDLSLFNNNIYIYIYIEIQIVYLVVADY